MPNEIKKVSFSNSFANWMKSPVAVITGLLLGLSFGIFAKDYVSFISIIGDLYLAFLKLAVIPVLITAISSSVAEMMLQNRISGGVMNIGKSCFILASLFLLCSAVSMTAGLVLKPGVGLSGFYQQMEKVTENSNSSIETRMTFFSKTNTVSENTGDFSFRDFVKNLVPNNFFKSLYEGNGLQLLVVSILFGLALGCINEDLANVGITMLNSAFQSCVKLIQWSMYILPISIFSLTAVQTASFGESIFVLMANFLCGLICCMLLLLLIGFVILRFVTGYSFKALFNALAKPFFIAFCTQSSLGAMPIVMDNIISKMKLNEKSIKVFLPFAITVGRFGPTVTFMFSTLFALQLYDVYPTTGQYVLLFFLTPVVAISTAGSSGAVLMAMISVILRIMTVPWEFIVALLTTLNVFLEPFSTLLSTSFSTYYSIMSTMLAAVSPGEKASQPSAEPAVPAA